MKRKLLSLCALFLMATSVGWAETENTKITQETIGGELCVFANGNAVTVKQSDAKSAQIVITSGDETTGPLDGSTVSLYGGSHNASVSQASITMESGTIRNIFGGGYGDLTSGKTSPADVTGKTAITITGGTVSNLLLAGGRYYAKSGEVEIKITGASVGCPLMGGYDQGKTTNKLETSYDQSVNRVKSTAFTMEGGSITNYIGCGGGQGYSYSKETNVTLKKSVNIAGLLGIGANGRSDKVTIKVDGCTFNEGCEFAAVNRGKVQDITMELNNCTFAGDLSKGHFQLGATHGWTDSDTDGTVIPTVTGSVDISLTNCTNAPDFLISQGLDGANVSLKGAKGVLDKVYKGTKEGKLGEIIIKDFVVNAGKTWTFSDGLVVNGATLTNNGTINATAKDINELKAAIAVNANTTLTGADYGSSSKCEPLGSITKAGVTIKAKNAAQKPNVYGTIKVLADGCTIDGLSMYTASDGSVGLKNIIDVVAMSATITNNEFNMLQPTQGNVSNGLNIWPYGNETTPKYVVKGNTFNGFKTNVTGWSSTAFLVTEGVELSRFGLGKENKSKAVVIADEDLFRIGNTFKDCFSDYVHNDWGRSDNAVEKAPLYKYAVVSSDANALSTAVNYSGDDAKIFAKGTYTFAKQLAIKKSISLIGIIDGTDTTTIVAKNWDKVTDKNDSTLINIQSANNVALKNLNVKNAERNGINVFTSTGVTLDNVKITNSKAAGLVVNGSTVKATNVRTSGSGWGYGVNVDKGKGVEGTPVFTIGDGCSFGEKIAIYADLKNATNDDASKYVVGNGWVMMKVKDKNEYYWANASESGINLAITSVPATVVWDKEKTIKLVANVENPKFAVSESSEEGVVEIDKDGMLKILKPGKAILTLTASDVTVQQAVTVLKKTITVKGVTAKEMAYNGKTDVELILNDEIKNAVKDIITSFTGVRSTATAGEAVPVEVKPVFSEGKDVYYTVAPITGVTVKVNKVALTVTTNAPSAINFGADLPTFTAKSEGFVDSENESNLTGTLAFDCPVTKTTLAGKYPVTPTGYSSPNYSITYTSADLEVKAIKPTAEITEVKINKVGEDASVTVNGRVLNNGGTKADAFKAKVVAKTGNVTKEVADIAIKADGTFTADVTGLSSAAYTMELTVSDTKLTSDVVTSSEINLAAKMQNIQFATVLNRLIYGTKAALKAEGYEKDAKVEFTTSDASVLALNEDKTEVTALKKGTATITATATLDQYVTAVAKQTVTVEPKTLTVTPTVAAKTYDGTKTANVSFALNGLVNNDKVDVVSTGAEFADANAGTDKVVTLNSALTLSSSIANLSDKYQLVQPTGLKGTINKVANIAVKAEGVSRRYNAPADALAYTLRFEGLNGDVAPEYEGVISITEGANGTYTVNASKAVFRNYQKATGVSGQINIIKGTPKVVTVNPTDKEAVSGLLVDDGGWGLTQKDVKISDESDGKQYAYVEYNGTKASGEAIAKARAEDVNLTWVETRAKANNSLLKSDAADKALTYGESAVLKVPDGYSIQSDPKVVTLTKAATQIEIKAASGTDYTVEAVGAGNAALLLTKTDGGAVVAKVVEVKRKAIVLTTTNVTKVYDGTTKANVTLDLREEMEGASLDLNNVTFSYASKDANEKDITISPSKPILLADDNADNYQLEVGEIKGKITPATLKVTSAVNKQYDGTKTAVLASYSAEGLVEGETVPVTATFGDAKVGDYTGVVLATQNANYTITEKAAGNIVKSTLEVNLPESATSESDLRGKIAYTIAETGAKVEDATAKKAISDALSIKADAGKFRVSGTDTENYVLVFASNTVTKGENPTPDPDPVVVPVTSVSLDKTTLSLARGESQTLKATINPSNATNKKVSWKSSDEKIAKVDADGKVTAVAVGKAIITVTTADGGKTAACEVAVGHPVGVDVIVSDSKVYGGTSQLVVEPALPVQVTVVSMAGQVIYNGKVSATTYISAQAGVYVVTLSDGKEMAAKRVIVH